MLKLGIPPPWLGFDILKIINFLKSYTHYARVTTTGAAWLECLTWIFLRKHVGTLTKPSFSCFGSHL